MKKQHVIIIILTTIAIAATTATAWGTVAILRSINSQKNTSSESDSKQPTESVEKTVRTDELEETPIDKEADKKAQILDKEAADLMSSDPQSAHQKYLEAKEAYSLAGNVSKASEMDANAMTATLLTKEGM